MRPSRRYLLPLVVAIAACPACAQTGDDQQAAQIKKPVSDAKVTLVQAMEIAQKEAQGGLLVSAELLPDDVPPAYLGKFLVAGKIKEVWIDGVDGHVQGSRTRDVVPEHRDWAAEFPSIVGKFQKSPLEMLREATEPPGGLTGACQAKFEWERGRWSLVVLLPP